MSLINGKLICDAAECGLECGVDVDDISVRIWPNIATAGQTLGGPMSSMSTPNLDFCTVAHLVAWATAYEAGYATERAAALSRVSQLVEASTSSTDPPA